MAERVESLSAPKIAEALNGFLEQYVDYTAGLYKLPLVCTPPCSYPAFAYTTQG